jgi:hypothetical protein
LHTSIEEIEGALCFLARPVYFSLKAGFAESRLCRPLGSSKRAHFVKIFFQSKKFTIVAEKSDFETF